MAEGPGRERLAGVMLSLSAAALFGILAPAAKASLAHVTPVRAAGLTYLAAGSVAILLLASRALGGGTTVGRRTTPRDAPRLLAIMLLGGVLGPLLFFGGIQRVAAHHAAILQHLEFTLTVLAAMAVLGERIGRRAMAGLGLVLAGLLLFSLAASPAAGPEPETRWLGIGLLVASSAAWAVDNTLSRGAAGLDPLKVVMIKGIGGGSALCLLTPGDAWPRAWESWALVLLAGGVGVGLSLVLELLALRRIGAARNAGLFATGPAFGFLWSLIFLGERSSTLGWLALAACAAGAVALSRERG